MMWHNVVLSSESLQKRLLRSKEVTSAYCKGLELQLNVITNGLERREKGAERDRVQDPVVSDGPVCLQSFTHTSLVSHTDAPSVSPRLAVQSPILDKTLDQILKGREVTSGDLATGSSLLDGHDSSAGNLTTPEMEASDLRLAEDVDAHRDRGDLTTLQDEL